VIATEHQNGSPATKTKRLEMLLCGHVQPHNHGYHAVRNQLDVLCAQAWSLSKSQMVMGIIRQSSSSDY